MLKRIVFAMPSGTNGPKSSVNFIPEALWQRCAVHFYCNVCRAVPASKVKELAAMLKAIRAQEDGAAARQKAEQVASKLKEMKLADAAALVLSGIDETLYYYAFPSEHWRRLRTNNPLERLPREVRRRTRAVGAFPDGKSALMLAAARLRHVAGKNWGTRRYLDMTASLKRAKQHEHARKNVRLPSGEPSTISPMPQQMCEKLWTLPSHLHTYICLIICILPQSPTTARAIQVFPEILLWAWRQRSKSEFPYSFSYGETGITDGEDQHAEDHQRSWLSLSQR
jgi:hypothetical protein